MPIVYLPIRHVTPPLPPPPTIPTTSPSGGGIGTYEKIKSSWIEAFRDTRGVETQCNGHTRVVCNDRSQYVDAKFLPW